MKSHWNFPGPILTKKPLMPWKLPLVLLFIASSLSQAGDLKVSADFSGGSVEVLDLDQENRILKIRPTQHQERGWNCWWYFRLTGITPGETITLDVSEAPWATPDRAAVSLDNVAWQQTDPGRRDGKRIVYRHKVDADACWFAWGPVFGIDEAQRLVAEAAKSSPHATAFELCQTRSGRPVPALIVRQEGAPQGQRRGIWVQARQHAWESGSSWVCRGFTEWLLSDDPQAEALRKQATVTIVPIMDIDNVAIGAGGKNQVPQDHNRDWSEQPHWNSVQAAQKRILEMNDAGQFDLFVDLHNPDAGSKNPFYFVPPKEQLTELGEANLQRFIATTQLEMTGPLTYKGDAKPSGSNYDKNWKKMSKNWVMANTHEGVVAVTLETAWNTPHSHSDGYRAVGQQLGKAMERYFRTAEAE